MKICRDCSNVCESDSVHCLRCGSSNLAVVSEKLCNYCKSRIVVGTIICPHCHRVLPPETETVIDSNVVMTSVDSRPSGDGATMHIVNLGGTEKTADVFEENAIKEFAMENAEKEVKEIKNEEKIDDFDKANPLFAIYDTAPDILPVKEEKEEENDYSRFFFGGGEDFADSTHEENAEDPADFFGETDMAEEGFIQEANEESGIQTVSFNTGVISHEEVKPQNPAIRYALFAWGFLFTLVAMLCNYMIHSEGNVLGYEMSAAVLVSFRDVFPSSYPYILYGMGLLPKYELLGSHLPFAMDFGMLFSLAGGICIMISAVPKWVCVALNALAVIAQVVGIWMMVFLFGFRSVGISAYILLVGSFSMLVFHIILVQKVYRNVL